MFRYAFVLFIYFCAFTHVRYVVCVVDTVDPCVEMLVTWQMMVVESYMYQVFTEAGISKIMRCMYW